MVEEGYIIQDTLSIDYKPNSFKYEGLCAYYSFPLFYINNQECRQISNEQAIIRDAYGNITYNEFIDNDSLLVKYLQLCKKYKIKTRILYANTNIINNNEKTFAF